MLLDVGGEEELDAHQPHSLDRQLGDLLRFLRNTDVHHDLGRCHRNGGHGHRGGLLFPLLLLHAFVDDAHLAVHRHLHAFLEHLGGIARPDHAGDAQLAGHDGGVAGHSALVGDDGGGPGHGRDHVGGGHLGDHYVAFHDHVHAHVLAEYLHHSAGDAGARPQPLGEDGALGCKVLPGLVRLGGLLLLLPVGQGGDGPGLHHEQFALLDAPLDVHRLVVVHLDLVPYLGELVDLLVGDLLRLGHLLRNVHANALAGLAPDQHPGLSGDALVEDLAVELVHGVGVRRHFPSDQRLSQAVAGLDDDVRQLGVGVDGEHDAGAIGRYHPLHHHGQLYHGVVEALLHAVCDRTRGEQGRPALLDTFQQRLGIADVEVGVLLAGERCGGQVLRRGRGTHRHQRVAAPSQLLILGDDLLLQVLRDLADLESGADVGGSLLDLRIGRYVEVLHDRGQEVPQSVALQEVVIGFRGQHEPRRDFETGRGQLTEVGCLTSCDRNIVHA